MQPKRPYAVYFYLCGSSLVFIVGGTVLICIWPLVYDNIMKGSSQLKPETFMFDMWKKSPIPFRLEFYFFNWTNPSDIYNSSTKPILQQVGPYVFRETKEKSNITWNQNDTISYKHLRTWYFDEENSPRKLNELVTTVNPVVTSAVYTSRNWNYLVKKGLSMTLGSMNAKIHTTRTVGQMLFEGYDDPLMKMAQTMSFLDVRNLPGKFGWFYGRNHSEDYDGVFNMNTGQHNQVGQIRSWKFHNHTSYYGSPCDNVEGSAGEIFPRNLTKGGFVKFFSSDLCRKVELEFEEQIKVNGILGYKYSAQDRFLDNGTKVPENSCFCVGDCMPSGAINVSACRFGSPAFVSLPNFYQADPYYINSVEGISSNKQDHEFYMVLEPTTSIPLEVAVRLQLNLRLQSIDSISLFENIPTLYFPMLWFQQVVRIPDNMAFYLKFLLNMKIIFTSVGIILIVTGFFLQFCAVYKICTLNICGKKKVKAIWREEVPLNPQRKIDLVKN